MVLVTAPQHEAEALARICIEEELVACVNILPAIKSIYRWEGNVDTSDESLLMMKTSSRLVVELEALISAAHSYDTPEFLIFNIDGGSGGYLAWLMACLRAP